MYLGGGAARAEPAILRAQRAELEAQSQRQTRRIVLDASVESLYTGQYRSLSLAE